ncbi:MAG: hypothetical protein AB1801_22065, partial [Chloroflexota bacterium]
MKRIFICLGLGIVLLACGLSDLPRTGSKPVVTSTLVLAEYSTPTATTAPAFTETPTAILTPTATSRP